MQKLACFKPDMAVLAFQPQPLSPFALLSSSFSDQLFERMGFSFGGYPMMDLTYLEEEELPENTQNQIPEIHLDLKLILKALKAGEKDAGKTQENRILERVLQLQMNRQTHFHQNISIYRSNAVNYQQSFPIYSNTANNYFSQGGDSAPISGLNIPRKQSGTVPSSIHANIGIVRKPQSVLDSVTMSATLAANNQVVNHLEEPRTNHRERQPIHTFVPAAEKKAADSDEKHSILFQSNQKKDRLFMRSEHESQTQPGLSEQTWISPERLQSGEGKSVVQLVSSEIVSGQEPVVGPAENILLSASPAVPLDAGWEAQAPIDLTLSDTQKQTAQTGDSPSKSQASAIETVISRTLNTALQKQAKRAAQLRARETQKEPAQSASPAGHKSADAAEQQQLPSGGSSAIKNPNHPIHSSTATGADERIAPAQGALTENKEGPVKSGKKAERTTEPMDRSNLSADIQAGMRSDSLDHSADIQKNQGSSATKPDALIVSAPGAPQTQIGNDSEHINPISRTPEQMIQVGTKPSASSEVTGEEAGEKEKFVPKGEIAPVSETYVGWEHPLDLRYGQPQPGDNDPQGKQPVSQTLDTALKTALDTAAQRALEVRPFSQSSQNNTLTMQNSRLSNPASFMDSINRSKGETVRFGAVTPSGRSDGKDDGSDRDAGEQSSKITKNGVVSPVKSGAMVLTAAEPMAWKARYFPSVFVRWKKENHAATGMTTAGIASPISNFNANQPFWQSGFGTRQSDEAASSDRYSLRSPIELAFNSQNGEAGPVGMGWRESQPRGSSGTGYPQNGNLTLLSISENTPVFARPSGMQGTMPGTVNTHTVFPDASEAPASTVTRGKNGSQHGNHSSVEASKVTFVPQENGDVSKYRSLSGESAPLSSAAFPSVSLPNQNRTDYHRQMSEGKTQKLEWNGQELVFRQEDHELPQTNPVSSEKPLERKTDSSQMAPALQSKSLLTSFSGTAFHGILSAMRTSGQQGTSSSANRAAMSVSTRNVSLGQNRGIRFPNDEGELAHKQEGAGQGSEMMINRPSPEHIQDGAGQSSKRMIHRSDPDPIQDGAGQSSQTNYNLSNGARTNTAQSGVMSFTQEASPGQTQEQTLQLTYAPKYESNPESRTPMVSQQDERNQYAIDRQLSAENAKTVYRHPASMGQAANHEDSGVYEALPSWAREFLTSGYAPIETVHPMTGVSAGVQNQGGNTAFEKNEQNPEALAVVKKADKTEKGFPAGQLMQALTTANPAKQMVWVSPNAGSSQAKTTPVDLSFREKNTKPESRQTETRMSEAEIKRAADRIYQIIETRLKQERRRMGY